MDSLSKILVTILSSIAVIVCGVLIGLGKDDAVTLGVILTLVLQAGTWLTTQTVAKRVNGHMTSLINAKTIAAETGEPVPAEGTNPNV